MLKPFCLAASTAALLALGACADTPTASSSSSAGPGKISGGILVAPSGMTLYVFDKDAPDSNKSTCNASCAALWPPLMARPTDRGSAPYSVIVRDDNSRQWAYKGRPLYTYKEDKKVGDKSGDNFKDVWHAATE